MDERTVSVGQVYAFFVDRYSYSLNLGLRYLRVCLSSEFRATKFPV